MNKRKVLRILITASVAAAVVLLSACGKSNKKGNTGSKKSSSTTAASQERRVEVITGTFPGEEDDSDLGVDSAGENVTADLNGKNGETGSDIDAAGNINKGKDTSNGKSGSATEDTDSHEDILPINTDDLIVFTTDYGEVRLIHEEGAINNLTKEVGEERYHDGGLGFYYNSKAGIKALIPGYYNYYQTDELGYDDGSYFKG